MTNNFVLLPYNIGQQGRWLAISEALRVVKDKCQLLRCQGIEAVKKQYGDGDPRYWLREAIYKYNANAKADCNFGVIQDNDDMVLRLIKVLPVIIDNAMSLPQRFKGSLRILKIGEKRTVTLNRNLICSLLAHAFLCTLQRRTDETYKELANFNFWRYLKLSS